MAVNEVLRRTYERRPYPTTSRDVNSPRFAHLPSLDWVHSTRRPGAPALRRALVAGCGTGAEAFELRRLLPEAELVAIDFSPRSIAIAQRLQKSAAPARPITFLVADLDDPRLVDRTGGGFDLVTCHGVLTYLPAPDRALHHLAACTLPDGVLYLGVNGDAHPGERVRSWLRGWGIDPRELSDERRLRTALRVWDRFQPDAAFALADKPATFLAGDICGPHFNQWSLARWRDTAARAGWRLAASAAAPGLLRRILAPAAHRPLYPCRLDELFVRLEGASPASFHRLLLRRASTADRGWDGTAPAGPCALHWTGLFSLRMKPARQGAGAWAVLTSSALELQLEWPLDARAAAAARALARARGQARPWPADWPQTAATRRTLWLWAAFGAIGISRPRRGLRGGSP